MIIVSNIIYTQHAWFIFPVRFISPTVRCFNVDLCMLPPVNGFASLKDIFKETDDAISFCRCCKWISLKNRYCSNESDVEQSKCYNDISLVTDKSWFCFLFNSDFFELCAQICYDSCHDYKWWYSNNNHLKRKENTFPYSLSYKICLKQGLLCFPLWCLYYHFQWIYVIHLPLFFRVASLARRQYYNCPSKVHLIPCGNFSP